jgi:hypothetical protein
MFKILKPFWNRASLGCRAAPLKKCLRISKIPVNGIHCADHHRMHWLSRYWSYFYACGVSVCGGNSKKRGFVSCKKGTSAHIPSVSLFYNPRTVVMFHTIPEQGKNQTSKQSIPEQHGLYFLTLFLTLKLSHPTVFSQSMSSTKSKWLFCLPNFCWAQMAICPMRYVAVLLFS